MEESSESRGISDWERLESFKAGSFCMPLIFIAIFCFNGESKSIIGAVDMQFVTRSTDPFKLPFFLCQCYSIIVSKVVRLTFTDLKIFFGLMNSEVHIPYSTSLPIFSPSVLAPRMAPTSKQTHTQQSLLSSILWFGLYINTFV